jgi:crotonobetainyl-CoA:carnitine CoA-transferase CaiB-like acyl-CoA transferase
MAHRAELAALLAAHVRRRPTREWLQALDAAGIPAGPIRSIGEMAADPQTLAREMVVELDHPVAGRTRTLGAPVKFGAHPGQHPAPGADLRPAHARDPAGARVQRRRDRGAGGRRGDPARRVKAAGRALRP